MAKDKVDKKATQDPLEAAVDALVALVVARDGNTPSSDLTALRAKAQGCLKAVGMGVELPRY